MKKLTGGFSGAKVYRVGNFVFKMNTGKSSKQQILKNNRAAEFYSENGVHSFLETRPLTIYEYIEGESIAEMLLDGMFTKTCEGAIKKLVNRIKNGTDEGQKNLFFSKFHEKLLQLSDEEDKYDLKMYLDYFPKKIKYLTNSIDENHGDLTLSNIIINKRARTHLIDGNPNYWNENFMLDLSKLLQDIESKWFVHLSGRKLPHTSKVVCEDLKELIYREFGKDLKYYQALDFMRVLPYATKERDKKYARKKIENLLSDV